LFSAAYSRWEWMSVENSLDNRSGRNQVVKQRSSGWSHAMSEFARKPAESSHALHTVQGPSAGPVIELAREKHYSVRGDFHPYEIRRRLTQAMIECFTDVDVGTFYYAARQLAECGLFTAVAHQRVARGGMRTVYRITPRGRDRFRELLPAQFAAEGDLRETLYGPMLFLQLADLNLVAEALRAQIHRQVPRLAEIRKLHRQWVRCCPPVAAT
jgi:DNA-binding PadR family transcriptional regulator